MTGRTGLVAGGGKLPIEFIDSAKRKGEEIVVFAIKGMAPDNIGAGMEKVYWLQMGEFAKFAFLLLKDRVKKIVFLGKVRKEIIYKEGIYDETSKEIFNRMKNKKDYSILKEVTAHLKKIGVEVIDPSAYLSHLFPESGFIGASRPEGYL